MSLQVHYMDAPVGAQETAAVTSTASQPFGTAQQMVSGAPDLPWATLEPGSWALDGTGRLLPETSAELGWWSEQMSGEDGQFAQPPILSVSFPSPYTATGLTFRFWPSLGQWCSEIHISWYREENLLAETTAYPNGADWVLPFAVENFDRVDIRLLATNIPGRFAKLQQLQIGQTVVFLQDEIAGVSLLNEADPTLCRLTVDTMIVHLWDRRNRTLLPQKDQSIRLYRDGKQIASQYITDSNRDSRQNYTFRCQSAIGRLEDDFLGGIYARQPIQPLLREVLGEFPFTVDSVFADAVVTGYLPVCTRREALQQIAFVIGAAVTTQGDGTIRLFPPDTAVSGSFDGSSIFAGAKVSREAQTAAVQLLVHSYGKTDEQETLLDQESVQGENVLFLFSEPHHSYGLTGGTLVDSGENWVRITADGEVVLTAKKYQHTTSVRTKLNPLATVAEKGNVVTVEKATLIHSGNAEDVLQRLYACHTLQQVLEQDVVVAGHRAGQLVESPNPWGSKSVGYITKMESEFTGTGHTAAVTIRGREVAE